MFDGAKRRRVADDDEASGLPSRFISDVETVERLTVSVLDVGSMMLVEFGSALVAIALVEPLTLVVTVPMLIATWVVTRRMQEPAATAGQRRQEELERMTQSIVRELADREDPHARDRFRAAAERLLAVQVRVGWLQAANREGSAGFAKLGPIAVVVAAAFAGSYRAGTLISLYLLAQRTFWGFDGLVDLSLGMQSVRGAVNRCFDLIDTPQFVQPAQVVAIRLQRRTASLAPRPNGSRPPYTRPRRARRHPHDDVHRTPSRHQYPSMRTHRVGGSDSPSSPNADRSSVDDSARFIREALEDIRAYIHEHDFNHSRTAFRDLHARP